MQFPVPQFTDVEDKIIGPLTLKQFGIIFATGVLVFLGYSATKSILVLVFCCLVFGIPAMGLAFAKINGRPVYNTMGYFFKFFTSPRLMVFHKEVSSSQGARKYKDAQMADQATAPVVAQTAESTQTHLRQVEELLRKTSAEERDVSNRLK